KQNPLLANDLKDIKLLPNALVHEHLVATCVELNTHGVGSFFKNHAPDFIDAPLGNVRRSNQKDFLILIRKSRNVADFAHEGAPKLVRSQRRCKPAKKLGKLDLVGPCRNREIG